MLFEERVAYAPLVLFEYDHEPGHYCLMLSDNHMVSDEQIRVFEDNGRDPGGYSWADVALGVVRTRRPELEERLDFDPEAGMFVAYGEDLEALRALAVMVHELYHDLAKLARAVADAPFEYD